MTRPRSDARAVVIILVGIAALVLHALPFDSSLTESADANSILLAMLVCVLIAEAIVFHSYLSNTFYGVTNQRVHHRLGTARAPSRGGLSR